MSVHWRNDRRRQALQLMLAGGVEGLEVLGRLVCDRSRELAPRRRGLLADSARLQTSADRRSVTVSYYVPYAAKVHEDTSAHHRRGQAKFLETALHQMLGGAAETIGRPIARRLS